LNESEVIRRQLFVTRCDPAAMLDLVEEPFDHCERDSSLSASRLSWTSPGGQREANRQAIGIDHRMYLAGEPTA
jgi:hypothetical protein